MGMAASFSKRYISWPLQALLARMLLLIFRLQGIDRGSDFGGWIGRKIGPRLSKSRTAQANLKLAFPEKSDAERRQIELDMWDNLGRVIAEYAHLETLLNTAEDRFDFQISPEAARVIMPEAPLVGIGGHLANWEAMAVAARSAGLETGIIYREPNNPHIRALLKRVRGPSAVKLFPKSPDGARAALKHLREGGFMGALIDQRFNRGAAVPFFGQDAMTATGPALMAVRSKAPMILVLMERLEGARFRVHIPPPIPVPMDMDRNAAAVEMTRDATAQIEAHIRNKPGQWLWIHNRWKGRKKDWQKS
ncbi:MAG: lysophospholipid acyltransferase family protein [Alphaproteobacteria bacterium]